MKYISVCSGIEAATVAWHSLGWKAAAYSEIEPFPSAVLAHHYPDIPNLGDMTKFKEWNIEPGSIDLLVGGTPCQSFSVAGLRKGLDDPRGNLMLTYLAIARQYRPRWLVWENVPGVLSSNGGLDFASLLRGMGECGYGFAYRILDAQYFGVAQRRRRVFVVGCLGDWRAAAAVLFERHSLSGHPAPSREKGKVAPTIPARSTAGGGLGTDFDLDGGVVGALYAGCGPNGHGGSGLATLQGATQGHLQVTQPYTVANTLTARTHKGINSTVDEGQTPVIAWDEELNASIEQAGTLLRGGAGGRHDGVMQPINIYGGNRRKDRPEGGFYVRADEDTSKTLDAATGLNPTCSQGGTAVMQSMQVRRLTPVECERLQGFPDNYTAIPWRGKAETPDGPRYKALGNSMAVPVMAWIGKRIQEFEASNAS